MDNLTANSKGNSRLYLMYAGCVVFLHCYHCFLSVCFVVAAVLEGVHFSFGSRPVLILFQLLILVQSAMPILLFFG